MHVKYIDNNLYFLQETDIGFFRCLPKSLIIMIIIIKVSSNCTGLLQARSSRGAQGPGPHQ